tara:strand:+ start:1492 stop:1602 length:111 start_codon:yes stop_codon:yes gene_type:complete
MIIASWTFRRFKNDLKKVGECEEDGPNPGETPIRMA